MTNIKASDPQLLKPVALRPRARVNLPPADPNFENSRTNYRALRAALEENKATYLDPQWDDGAVFRALGNVKPDEMATFLTHLEKVYGVMPDGGHFYSALLTNLCNGSGMQRSRVLTLIQRGLMKDISAVEAAALVKQLAQTPVLDTVTLIKRCAPGMKPEVAAHIRRDLAVLRGDLIKPSLPVRPEPTLPSPAGHASAAAEWLAAFNHQTLERAPTPTPLEETTTWLNEHIASRPAVEPVVLRMERYLKHLDGSPSFVQAANTRPINRFQAGGVLAWVRNTAAANTGVHTAHALITMAWFFAESYTPPDLQPGSTYANVYQRRFLSALLADLCSDDVTIAVPKTVRTFVREFT